MDFHAMCSNNMQAVMVLICILLAFFVVSAAVHFCTPEVEDDYSLIALAVEDDSDISKVDCRTVAAGVIIMGLVAWSTVITQYKFWRVVTSIESNTIKISGIVMLAVGMTCHACVSICAGETMETQPDQPSTAVTPSDIKEAECGATQNVDAQEEHISDVKKAKCGATQDYDALKELISTLKELLKSMECKAELEKQPFIREAMNAAHNDEMAALGWELALKNASWAQKEADWMQKEATWKQRETDWEQAEQYWQEIDEQLNEDLRTATQSAKDNADKLQQEVKRTDAFHKDHKKAKQAVADFLKRAKPILNRVHLDDCLGEFRATIDKEYAWISAPLKRYVDLKKELCKVYQEKFEAERNDGNSNTKPSAYTDTPQIAHNDVSLAATSGPISKGQLHLPPHPDTVTPPPSRIIKQAYAPSRTVAKWAAASASSKSTPEPPSVWTFTPHPSTTAPLPPSTQRAREPVSSAPYTGEQEAPEHEIEDYGQPDAKSEHDDSGVGSLFGDEAVEDDEKVEEEEEAEDAEEAEDDEKTEDDEEIDNDEHNGSDEDDDEDHGNSGAAGAPSGGNGGDSADDQGQHDDSDAQDHRGNEPHQQDPEEDVDEDDDSDEDDNRYDGDAGAAGVAFAPPGDNGSDTFKDNCQINFPKNDDPEDSKLTHRHLDGADEACRAMNPEEDEDPQDTTKINEDDELRQANTFPEDDEPQHNNGLEEDEDDREAAVIEEDNELQGTTEFDPGARLPQDQTIDAPDTAAPQKVRTRPNRISRKVRRERQQLKKGQEAEAPISTEEEAEAGKPQIQAPLAAKKVQPVGQKNADHAALRTLAAAGGIIGLSASMHARPQQHAGQQQYGRGPAHGALHPSYNTRPPYNAPHEPARLAEQNAHRAAEWASTITAREQASEREIAARRAENRQHLAAERASTISAREQVRTRDLVSQSQLSARASAFDYDGHGAGGQLGFDQPTYGQPQYGDFQPSYAQPGYEQAYGYGQTGYGQTGYGQTEYTPMLSASTAAEYGQTAYPPATQATYPQAAYAYTGGQMDGYAGYGSYNAGEHGGEHMGDDEDKTW